MGRFQPFHLGHVEYLERAKDRCDRLFIGITNPDPHTRMETAADPNRSKAASNPFTFFERAMMIEAALIELGWSEQSFLIVPAPIHHPEILASYIPGPERAVFYATVYDAWGDQKVAELSEMGYDVEVMWRRSHRDRLTSGTDIRSAISDGRDWRNVVPQAVFKYIREHGLEKVIAEQ